MTTDVNALEFLPVEGSDEDAWICNPGSTCDLFSLLTNVNCGVPQDEL